MKIGICSDSHDNLINIAKFLHYCAEQEIQTIIHAGDWCSAETLKFFRQNFTGKIYGVYGNVHGQDFEMTHAAEENDIDLRKHNLKLNFDKINIYITHYPDKAKNFAKKKSGYLIIYGHTHKPWLEKVNQNHLANPGTLAGLFQKATFAVYDSAKRKLELKLLQNI